MSREIFTLSHELGHYLLKKEDVDEQYLARNPKPIQSNLVFDIYNYALNKGVVSEYEYCSALNIKPNDISRVFYEGSH